MEQLAFCGLRCDTCECYLSKKAVWSREKREKLAKEWAKLYHHAGLKAEDMSCDGCQSDSKENSLLGATTANSGVLRSSPSREFSNLIFALKSGELNPRKSSETVFRHCQACEIRKCGRKKRVENCGCCDEYPCGKLSEFFEQGSGS